MKKIFPLCFLIFLYLSPSIDHTLSGYFYSHAHFSTYPLFESLYNFGEYPAQFIALLSGFLYVCAFFLRSLHIWQRHFLYLFLTLAIGAFALNELTLKNHWGRPRPKQTIEFGGTQPFRPFYQPNFFAQPEPSRSFPCGHCTAGYYFFTLYFLLARLHHRKAALIAFFFALTFGSLIGLARIAQGGHYFTDVIFGALIMWLTAWGLDKILYPHNKLTSLT